MTFIIFPLEDYVGTFFHHLKYFLFARLARFGLDWNGAGLAQSPGPSQP
jgi:hypothetical protein